MQSREQTYHIRLEVAVTMRIWQGWDVKEDGPPSRDADAAWARGLVRVIPLKDEVDTTAVVSANVEEMASNCGIALAAHYASPNARSIQ